MVESSYAAPQQLGDIRRLIHLSKDALLDLANNTLQLNVKKSASKLDIFSKIQDLYASNDVPTKELIIRLPYQSYLLLQELIGQTAATGSPIAHVAKKINFDSPTGAYDDYSLKRLALIVLDYNYQTNHYLYSRTVALNLKRTLFAEDCQVLYKHYNKMEQLIRGMLNLYGVVDQTFFRLQLSRYMDETVTQGELNEFISKRINLTDDIAVIQAEASSDYDETNYLTSADLDYSDIDLGTIVEAQHRYELGYKQFSQAEVLACQQAPWTEAANHLYDLIQRVITETEADIDDSEREEEYDREQFGHLLRSAALDFDPISHIAKLCRPNTIEQADALERAYAAWYATAPIYGLGGHSREDLVKSSTGAMKHFTEGYR